MLVRRPLGDPLRSSDLPCARPVRDFHSRALDGHATDRAGREGGGAICSALAAPKPSGLWSKTHEICASRNLSRCTLLFSGVLGYIRRTKLLRIARPPMRTFLWGLDPLRGGLVAAGAGRCATARAVAFAVVVPDCVSWGSPCGDDARRSSPVAGGSPGSACGQCRELARPIETLSCL